jgi:hypothetical protein
VPATTREVIAGLSAATPATDRASQRLITRRLAAVRQALIEATGISPDRVVNAETTPAVGVPGPGRVEFTLLPS